MSWKYLCLNFLNQTINKTQSQFICKDSGLFQSNTSILYVIIRTNDHTKNAYCHLDCVCPNLSPHSQSRHSVRLNIGLPSLLQCEEELGIHTDPFWLWSFPECLDLHHVAVAVWPHQPFRLVQPKTTVSVNKGLFMKKNKIYYTYVYQ